MGTGEIGGDRHWTSPVHGATAEGDPVTASFGQGQREGDTLIRSGHAGFDEFYAKTGQSKGHDHYEPDGTPAGGQERGNLTS